MKKRFFSWIILFLFSVCANTEGYAQSGIDNTLFQIEGQILGKDTGLISIEYTDALNLPHYDSVRLTQGRFTYRGHIRTAAEMVIKTEQHFRYFDDFSFIRFIAAPGLIKITKRVGVKRATISGSNVQMEKDKWDDAQSIYTRPEDSCFAMFDSLKALDVKNNQSAHKEQIALLVSKWSDFRKIGYRMDVNYVVKHPEAYLSGYLLKHVSRQISIDSVMQLYTTLADSVKNSTLGYDLLSKIYLLTDNKEFKSKNPLFNRELNKRLLEGSIHEFSLQDITGKQVDFKQFKGKYLVIDTWASWCGPCIANMPAWNKLVEQYDTSVIRFITVSVDIDDSEWKQAVAAYKPGGFQLHDPAAFNGLFAVYCKVIALPKIIIADPAGNIINYDGPHPNQPEFRTLLNSLVKKTDL